MVLVDASVGDDVGAWKEQDVADVDGAFLVVHYEHGRASEVRKKGAPPPRAAKLRALQGDGAVWGRMDSYRPSAYATALMFLNATPPILA